MIQTAAQKSPQDVFKMVEGALEGHRAAQLVDMINVGNLSGGRQGLKIIRECLRQGTLSSMQRIQRMLSFTEDQWGGAVRRSKIVLALKQDELGREPTSEDLVAGEQWLAALTTFVDQAVEGLKIDGFFTRLAVALDAACAEETLQLLGCRPDGSFDDKGRTRFSYACALYALFKTPHDQWPQDSLKTAEEKLKQLVDRMKALYEASQPIDVPASEKTKTTEPQKVRLSA